MRLKLFATRRSPISRKILVAILAISSLATICIAITQVVIDYQSEIRALENNIQAIEASRLGAIARSVAVFDAVQTQAYLEGLLNIPGVRYVAVRSPDRSIVAQAGLTTLSAAGFLWREFDLARAGVAETTGLGDLVIVASYDHVYARIYDRIFVILVSQFIKTLLVSLALYLVIYHILTHGLLQIIRYVEKFDFLDLPRALFLQRSKLDWHRRDELDTLVESINAMRDKLIRNYDELRELNQSLETRVDEKTQLIAEQWKKLEHSARMNALYDMAGGMAHEINNPLAIIVLRTEQVEEALIGGEVSPENILAYVQNVKKTAARIAKIVSGLRAFSHDPVEDTIELVPFRAIVEETFGLCQERLTYGNVSLEFFMRAAASVQIECKPFQISQVLLNLLSNSYHAVRSQPDKWIRVEVRDLGEVIELSVTDSGRGVPDDVRTKIMQPFFTTRDMGSGAGMGLSISQGIVNAHGGSLYLDESSAHTRFVVMLPKRYGKRHVPEQVA